MFAIWKSSLVPAPISPRVGTLTSKKQTAIHSCTVELVGMKTTLRASSCVYESAPMLLVMSAVCPKLLAFVWDTFHDGFTIPTKGNVNLLSMVDVVKMPTTSRQKMSVKRPVQLNVSVVWLPNVAGVKHIYPDISTTRPQGSVISLFMVAARVTATTFQHLSCARRSAKKFLMKPSKRNLVVVHGKRVPPYFALHHAMHASQMMNARMIRSAASLAAGGHVLCQ